MRNLFLTDRFFVGMAVVAAGLALSFAWPLLFPLFQALGGLLLLAVVVDALLIFNKNLSVGAQRHLPKVFSLGDANEVRIELENRSAMPLDLRVVDELPFQFQRRDFEMPIALKGGERQTLAYLLTPSSRGEYGFGDTLLFLRTPLGLAERRIRQQNALSLPVYPSILQMKQFELKAFKRLAVDRGGVKKIRRIGHSYEFEQIKTYVRGDDYRSINWKATGRTSSLMVNQYEDERSQQIYCIIDKSRSMKMPFNELSLMDYAINTALVISNIALKKSDRTGLITFSDIIGSSIKAERAPTQLNKILQALYREKERLLEANYELLYSAVRRLIAGRSLIFLFTNFESSYAMERVLPLLRRIGHQHLLVVVFFENTEINDFAHRPAKRLSEVFVQNAAQKLVYEKAQIVQTLKQYGIQAILTRPEELSLNTVNKYLELKSRGLI
jgi:uncharacterized protein (DUF58 family)